ncbi:hypothetical protein BgiMline_029020, partial [Biomphalaria glabrata]
IRRELVDCPQNKDNRTCQSPCETLLHSTGSRAKLRHTMLSEFSSVKSYTDVSSLKSYTDVSSVKSYRDVSSVKSYTDVSSVKSYTDVSSVKSCTDVSSVKSYTDVSSLKSYTDAHAQHWLKEERRERSTNSEIRMVTTVSPTFYVHICKTHCSR